MKSVIVFGRILPVTDGEKTKEICTALCRKFTDDEAYLQHELRHAPAGDRILQQRTE